MTELLINGAMVLLLVLGIFAFWQGTTNSSAQPTPESATPVKPQEFVLKPEPLVTAPTQPLPRVSVVDFSKMLRDLYTACEHGVPVQIDSNEDYKLLCEVVKTLPVVDPDTIPAVMPPFADTTTGKMTALIVVLDKSSVKGVK